MRGKVTGKGLSHLRFAAGGGRILITDRPNQRKRGLRCDRNHPGPPKIFLILQVKGAARDEGDPSKGRSQRGPRTQQRKHGAKEQAQRNDEGVLHAGWNTTQPVALSEIAQRGSQQLGARGKRPANMRPRCGELLTLRQTVHVIRMRTDEDDLIAEETRRDTVCREGRSKVHRWKSWRR